MLAVLLLSLAASAATIRIEPPSSLTSPGGVVNVNVTIADVTSLYAYQFDLAFDPSVLSATGITEGGFLRTGGGGTFFIPGTIDNALGTIAFTANTLLGPEPGVTGTGSLATVQFRGIDIGTSAVTLSNAVLLDSLGNEITAELEHGSVTVVPEPGSALLVVLAASALFALPGRAR
jgi:general secretion pathway protein D